MPGLSQGYPCAEGSGATLQAWGFGLESPQLSEHLPQPNLDTLHESPQSIPAGDRSQDEPGLPQPRSEECRPGRGQAGSGQDPSLATRAKAASMCSHCLLCPGPPLWFFQTHAVLQDETKEPTAPERDLDWETRPPGSHSGLVN